MRANIEPKTWRELLDWRMDLSFSDRFHTAPYVAEGVAAYMRGKELSDNPYPNGTLESKAWRFGWMAEQESQG